MNVQNIPRDDKVVKQAFVPKLDAFLFADYPNIEAKLLAYYLERIGFPSMADFFREDPLGDLHVKTASMMYGIPESEVTDVERQPAKRCNFSIIYGGGIPTLIDQGVAKDAKEAVSILKRYHGAWPGIGWHSKREPAAPHTLNGRIIATVKARKTATEPGYITTLWGRHLHPRSEHSALNALVQGCAADLLKWALVNIHRFTVENDLRSHLVNQVHDEVMLDVTEDELPLLAYEVPGLMTYEPVNKLVPIRPDPEVSYTTWADKAPIIERKAA